MSERFIKFIPSEEAFWVMQFKPNAFLLLMHIANTARRTHGHPDGLTIGQCHLKHWKFYGFSQQEYRTAKKILVDRKHIKIIETNRTRKKSTTGATTSSTIVELCSTTIYDINPEFINDRINDRATTDQRLTNDKQEGRRRIKKEKEDHPSIPSFQNAPAVRDDLGSMTDDSFFSKSQKSEKTEKIEIVPGVWLTQSEIDSCVRIKGTLESVKHAIEFIQGSKKRKHPISDWPNALEKWKVENKLQTRLQEHTAYAESLCEEFSTYEKGNGCRCYILHDKKKDDKGISFEFRNLYKPLIFISFADIQFHKKCEDVLIINKMRTSK